MIIDQGSTIALTGITLPGDPKFSWKLQAGPYSMLPIAVDAGVWGGDGQEIEIVNTPLRWKSIEDLEAALVGVSVAIQRIRFTPKNIGCVLIPTEHGYNPVVVIKPMNWAVMLVDDVKKGKEVSLWPLFGWNKVHALSYAGDVIDILTCGTFLWKNVAISDDAVRIESDGPQEPPRQHAGSIA